MSVHSRYLSMGIYLYHWYLSMGTIRVSVHEEQHFEPPGLCLYQPFWVMPRTWQLFDQVRHLL